jgi:hypothetical protein
MSKRPQLHLVNSNDPASIFDNLDGLRASMPPVASAKRARSVATFARFPHEQALKLRSINGSGWLIMVELDRQILKERGHNPVRLTNYRLRELGIGRMTKQRQLRKLEEAGVIRVVTKERTATEIAHLWFPIQP